MAQPFHPMVLSGAATPAQLLSNFQAVKLAARLEPARLRALQEQLLQDRAAYWEERGALAWN